MQTKLAPPFALTPEGQEADSILRSCVHCGFCTATCPTYQILSDEDDGPRGRIYLIKSVLEGNAATAKTQQHLDRCLTCRACETTCPSGVNYHRLLDIGRAEVDKQVQRPLSQRVLRWLIVCLMPNRHLFTPLMKLGQFFRFLLPPILKEKVPPAQRLLDEPTTNKHSRKMLLLEGCVQPSMAPNINIATRRVLNALGIELQSIQKATCCGALRHHLNATDAAANDMRQNIDVWLPELEQNAEALVVNASGCGAHIKDYGKLLANDPQYAEKAASIADKSVDIADVLLHEKTALLTALKQLPALTLSIKVAFHSPCTLQHGQGITHVVENLLTAAGYELVPVADSHLCCGSAGTYSIFEPSLSKQLRDNKLDALSEHQPDIIATANIGCLSQLQAAASTPVKHWIELIDDVLSCTS